MEYLMAMLGSGALCGFALTAYALLDSIEREEQAEDDRIGRAERKRALRPLRPPLNLAYPLPHARTIPLLPGREHRSHDGGVAAYADWADERVRALEERLDQLVRDRRRGQP